MRFLPLLLPPLLLSREKKETDASRVPGRAELAAFVQYATKLFNGTLDEDDNEEASESEEEEADKKTKKKAKSKSAKGKKKDVLLDEWPEEHYGLIVKLVHESCVLPFLSLLLPALSS